MADWPTADDLNRLLNVDPAEADRMTGIIDGWVASAINRVKGDVGLWDADVDEPNENLSAAALRMAELIALRPEAQPGVLVTDPAYQRLITGYRRRFGVA